MCPLLTVSMEELSSRSLLGTVLLLRSYASVIIEHYVIYLLSTFLHMLKNNLWCRRTYKVLPIVYCPSKVWYVFIWLVQHASDSVSRSVVKQQEL